MTDRRNLAEEFEAMGIESDDAEFQELEQRDRQHQAERCREEHQKDARDIIAWMKANRPAKHCWSKSQKPTDSSCNSTEST